MPKDNDNRDIDKKIEDLKLISRRFNEAMDAVEAEKKEIIERVMSKEEKQEIKGIIDRINKVKS